MSRIGPNPGALLAFLLTGCWSSFTGSDSKRRDSGAPTGSDSGDTAVEPDADGDGSRRSDGDCDDTNAELHPGVDELCDGVDQDCDGNTDEGALDRTVW